MREMNLLEIKYSPIGLGCVTFGREIDEKSSFEMMDYASVKGINLFDTAAAYGKGASERIIGKWIRKHPDKKRSIIISTKILPPYTPDHIQNSVNESLRRLQLPTIDLLYLHQWSQEAYSERALTTFQRLMDRGLVRQLGVSNFDATQLGGVVECQRKYRLNRIGAIQNNQNYAVRDLNEEILKICKVNRIKIITYSPLGAGFLTGKYQNKLPENSRFSLIPGHQKIYFNPVAIKRYDKLKEIATFTGQATTTLALIWAFRQKQVSSVLIGGRSVRQLEQAFLVHNSKYPEIEKMIF